MIYLFFYFILISFYYNIEASVHIDRSGPRSILKNCDNKPCYQGKCEGNKCRCFAGWSGQQCDQCYGRSLLLDEMETVTDGPKNYSSSSRCMWMINDVKKYGQAMLLRFNSFETECSWDHVYIYEGDGIYGEQLAALSGLMSGVELTVSSGKAVVYFSSDLAYNLPGFNISIAYGKCPANCTGNGLCKQGVCHCHDGFIGSSCDYQICAAKDVGIPDVSACSSSGYCDKNLRCVCNPRFHGDRCQAPSTSSVFERILIKNRIGARASHVSLYLENGTIFVDGGTYFPGSNFSNVALFDISTSSWRIPVTINEPLPLYDHSIVQHKNKLLMFGGVKNNRNITNELWTYDLLTYKWSLVESVNNISIELPYAVAGHKAFVIENEMFVFFGYNPVYGYLYRIQKYDIGRSSWSLVNDNGPHILGRFGHSLVSYSENKKSVLLIYGGYVPRNEDGYSGITKMLIEYKCRGDQCWHRLLLPGLAPVLRHAATILNGIMIVIGGSRQNESSATKTNDCYSNVVQAYDIGCDSWYTISDGLDAKLLERYGHTSVAVRNSIYILGGFNGTMLNDIVKFTPAKCDDFKSPNECRDIHDGIRCAYSSGRCRSVDDANSKHPSLFAKIDTVSRIEASCQNTLDMKSVNTYCSFGKSCGSCVLREGCGWCEKSGECVELSQNQCGSSASVASSNLCPEKQEPRSCSFAHECSSCKKLEHCVWYPTKVGKWKCISLQEMAVTEEERTPELESAPSAIKSWSAFSSTVRNSSCPASCFEHEDCSTCIKNRCMWCPNVRRCVRMDAYLISFPYGQCQSWITASHTQSDVRSCQLDPSDCSKPKTCAECERVGPKCGWCDDGSGTGLGKCLPGSLSAPQNTSLCPSDGKSKWYFTTCSACQCNGHSNCTAKQRSENWIEEQTCTFCDQNTTGDHCQFCADGYFGDARNGGKCEECQCNGQARSCHRETGDCFCTTKGVSGRNCNKCDQKYYGDPENNQPCYYEVTVDFIFTFKLDQDDPKDKYVNQINFFSTPRKRDTDVQFMVVCESPRLEKALVSMSINSSLFEGHPGMSKPLMARTLCDENGIRRTYSSNAEPGFFFGTDSNTTFLVSIHNFSTSIKIQISFSQSPPINWILFFVIFAACFVVLLVVAGLLWMIKLRIEVFRRNQRRYDEIEQMASRPFGSVRLELSSPCANLMATPISIEPCSNYRVGVFTLAVRLPTGGRQFTPHGTSGLALASTFCYLAPAQLGVLQAPESDHRQRNRKTNFKRYIPFIRA